MKYNYFVTLFCIILHILCGAQADLIVFSYDRPLQLYAFLESLEKKVTGIQTTMVIYRTSDQSYLKAYNIVQKTFPSVSFTKQGSQPKKDFKPLTVKTLCETPNDYILFAVDDIIVTDFIDINECINALEQTQAYGFYLRLGTNITESYGSNGPLKKKPPLKMVKLKMVKDDIYTWQFVGNCSNWEYPNTVDMTLYRKKNIVPVLTGLNYSSPNTLESSWAAKGITVQNKLGLCYAQSKIVNIPLNRVQNDYKNKHMNAFSPKELLEIFNKKLKIDIQLFEKISNKSPHMEYEPQFIAR